jgi:hypothetical protein
MVSIASSRLAAPENQLLFISDNFTKAQKRGKESWQIQQSHLILLPF